MGDGRPTCNRVLTSGSVGMGILMGIPVGIPVGMGWVWGLKCHPHVSPDYWVIFRPKVSSAAIGLWLAACLFINSVACVVSIYSTV